VTRNHSDDHEQIGHCLNNAINIRSNGAGLTADDTTAINTSLTEAGANGAIYFPGNGTASTTYTISSTITIKCHVYSDPNVQLSYTGSGTAVQIGDGVTQLGAKRLQLPEIAKLTKTWMTGTPDAGDIGLRVVGCDTCIIDVPLIINFATGLRITATSTAAGHGCIYRIARLVENAVQVLIKPETGAAFYTNTHQIWIQHLYWGTAFTPNTAGIRGIDIVNSSNNTFYGGRFESYDAPEYIIRVSPGDENAFYINRWEFNDGTQEVLYETTSKGNLIFVGNGLRNVNIVSSGTGKNIAQYFTEPGELVIDAGGEDVIFDNANPVLKAPNNGLWRLTVDNAGALSTTSV